MSSINEDSRPRDLTMIPLVGPIGALAVAGIFYTYRDYVCHIQAKHRQLRERVTFLLWKVAERAAD